MPSRTIGRDQWRTFFDTFSDALTGKRVEIEAASLELGDQIVAEWMPLLGITYDTKDDLLDVSLGNMDLDHLIRHPRDIRIQEGSSGIETIAVVSEDGTKQILRLKDPLMLPAGGREPIGAKR
jgi:hypothetical protein